MLDLIEMTRGMHREVRGRLVRGDRLGAAGGHPQGPAGSAQGVVPRVRDPANRHRAVPFTLKQFHYAFTNTLSEEESAEVYERYHIADTRLIPHLFRIPVSSLAVREARPQAARRPPGRPHPG